MLSYQSKILMSKVKSQSPIIILNHQNILILKLHQQILLKIIVSGTSTQNRYYSQKNKILSRQNNLNKQMSNLLSYLENNQEYSDLKLQISQKSKRIIQLQLEFSKFKARDQERIDLKNYQVINKDSLLNQIEEVQQQLKIAKIDHLIYKNMYDIRQKDYLLLLKPIIEGTQTKQKLSNILKSEESFLDSQSRQLEYLRRQIQSSISIKNHFQQSSKKQYVIEQTQQKIHKLTLQIYDAQNAIHKKQKNKKVDQIKAINNDYYNVKQFMTNKVDNEKQRLYQQESYFNQINSIVLENQNPRNLLIYYNSLSEQKQQMMKQIAENQKKIWEIKQEVEELEMQKIKEDFRIDLHENSVLDISDYHGLNEQIQNEQLDTMIDNQLRREEEESERLKENIVHCMTAQSMVSFELLSLEQQLNIEDEKLEKSIGSIDELFEKVMGLLEKLDEIVKNKKNIN